MRNQSLQTHRTNAKVHVTRCQLFSLLSTFLKHKCSNHEKQHVYIYRQCTRLSDVRNFSLCDDAANGTSKTVVKHILILARKKAATQSESAIAFSVKQNKIKTMRNLIKSFATKQRGWSLNSTSWAWWIEYQRIYKQAIPVNAHQFSKFPA